MESVRTGLRQIMSDLLRSRPPEEAVLLAWPLVCGREVAARSEAVTFQDGRLTVRVSDPAWRSQLQAFTARYVAGYDQLFGPLVQSVRFEVAHRSSAQAAPATVKESGHRERGSDVPMAQSRTPREQ